MSTTGGDCGAVCGVANAPVLRALIGVRRVALLVEALQSGSRGRNVEVSRIGGSSKNENKVETAYSDRALMLHFPVLLLWARGTVTPPVDWPEGATLGSAWRLEAVCAGVSALAGVLLPIAGGGNPCPVTGVVDLLPAAGGGDLRPAVGAGDLRSVPARGGSTNDPDVSLASPSVTGISSSPAPR